jgi:hypothetical protein
LRNLKHIFFFLALTESLSKKTNFLVFFFTEILKNTKKKPKTNQTFSNHCRINIEMFIFMFFLTFVEVMPKTKTSKPVLNQQPSDICKPTAKLPTKDGIQLNSQPTNIQPTNSGDQRTNYRNTDRSKTTSEPEVQYNIDPVKLKERGNLEFKSGHYMQAMDLYSDAIKAQKSKTKTECPSYDTLSIASSIALSRCDIFRKHSDLFPYNIAKTLLWLTSVFVLDFCAFIASLYRFMACM